METTILHTLTNKEYILKTLERGKYLVGENKENLFYYDADEVLKYIISGLWKVLG